MIKINWDTSKKKLNVYGSEWLLKRIPLTKINSDFALKREVMTRKNNIESIKKGMLKGDKMPPILVTKRRSGLYSIEDGHHRYYAVLDLNGMSGFIMAYVVK